MVLKKRFKTAKRKRKDVFLAADSPFMQYLREQVEAAPPEVQNMSLEDLRRLLDEELGDVSLTEELLRMRHE